LEGKTGLKVAFTLLIYLYLSPFENYYTSYLDCKTMDSY
jgi:hypothetical protein